MLLELLLRGERNNLTFWGLSVRPPWLLGNACFHTASAFGAPGAVLADAAFGVSGRASASQAQQLGLEHLVLLELHLRGKHNILTLWDCWHALCCC